MTQPGSKVAAEGTEQAHARADRLVLGYPARKLTRPVAVLLAVIAFQLLFASVFLGLHQPTFHHTPVGVTGSPRLAAVLARQERGAIDLLPEPSAAAAQAAIHDGRAYGAIVGGRRGTTLLIASAASPGTASLLTRQLTKDAAVTGTPLLVRDLAPLPASDPTGTSVYFLVIAWMLGGYVGATALSLMMGGPRASRLREVILRLAMLAGYAAASGLLGAAIIGPVLGIVPGYSTWLAACGALLVFAAGAATAGLQAALGLPGTLIAIVAMVVFGNPTAGTSIAAPLLASPWDVLGQLLPPGAALSLARNIVYHVDNRHHPAVGRAVGLCAGRRPDHGRHRVHPPAQGGCPRSRAGSYGMTRAGQRRDRHSLHGRGRNGAPNRCSFCRPRRRGPGLRRCRSPGHLPAAPPPGPEAHAWHCGGGRRGSGGAGGRAVGGSRAGRGAWSAALGLDADRHHARVVADAPLAAWSLLAGGGGLRRGRGSGHGWRRAGVGERPGRGGHRSRRRTRRGCSGRGRRFRVAVGAAGCAAAARRVGPARRVPAGAPAGGRSRPSHPGLGRAAG